MITLLRRQHVAFDGPNRRGWLVLTCPKCGKPYLGWNCNSSLFFCWYDKGMPLLPTLAKLLHKSEEEAKAILDLYQTRTRRRVEIDDDRTERPSSLEWPEGVGPIRSSHARYLQSRGLDPDEIVSKWAVRGVEGGAAPLYANRIYAPLVFMGEEVSWQGRAVSRHNSLRYVTCPDKQEVIPSKSIVYGWDFVVDETAIVVEGLFDVWKGGEGCVHTFGVAWTSAQLRLLSTLKTVVVAYDAEPQAVKSATLLAEALDGLGVASAILKLDEKDFGVMPVDEVRALVKETLAAVRPRHVTVGAHT